MGSYFPSKRGKNNGHSYIPTLHFSPFSPMINGSVFLVKTIGSIERWPNADRKHICILISENYLSSIRAPNVLKSHRQLQPNESAGGEQAAVHCQECQNLIHWHFWLVRTPLHAGPDYKIIVILMMRCFEKIIANNFFFFPCWKSQRKSSINKWQSPNMVG